MHVYYFIAYTAIKSSQTLLLLHHILLHHIHYSHFITCPAIASSHTLLFLHHIHYSYFITGYVSTSSHALLLLPTHALLSLHHRHCYFTICTAITVSHALCGQRGSNPRLLTLIFSSTQKEKEKKRHQTPHCSGEPFPKGGLLRSGSYCGAALHRRYLMVLASAQLGVRPERKDRGHPALCNTPPP